MWLGLTGSRLKGEDAVAAGVCDWFMPSSELSPLFEMLETGEAPSPPSDRPGIAQIDEINQVFAGDSVEAILAALERAGSDWAARQRATILSKSPTCTRIAFRQIREGASLEFEDCMALEYRLARFCMTRPDFYEGVRAVILDKDNAPKWRPATLAEADEAHVAPAFKSLGDEELVLEHG